MVNQKPSKRQCPECGTANGLKPFKNATLEARAKGGLSAPVPNLSGMRCSVCGLVTLSAPSLRAYARVSDALVYQARDHAAHELKRTRLKLGLSQQQAAQLTGGGHNAFSRYELGKAQPLPAVLNLFRLLDKHPELLQELPPS